MEPLYPGAAASYVKKVIEILECEKDEKSTIVQCAMAKTVPIQIIALANM